ncbi:hypothetical protein [Brachybacterium vulturis]|uniref:hypothetical protein n=1 Tax=Brachybacterium vulturis TaxID=2017484 RepID=UPI0037353416
MPQLSRWPRRLGETLRLFATALRGWGARQVLTAVVTATGIAVLSRLRGQVSCPLPAAEPSRSTEIL